MSSVFEVIDDRLQRFIERQPLFFVGTAPRAEDGHINVSPKGVRGTWRVLDERRVAYLDFTGSGVETIAHLRENGRIVLLFCAFSGPPKIVRVHGAGEAVFPDDARFRALRAGFGEIDNEHALRSIVVVTAKRISDSCGYGVPRMSFRGERPHLGVWQSKKSAEEIAAYRERKNRRSLDDLPALPEPGE